MATRNPPGGVSGGDRTVVRTRSGVSPGILRPGTVVGHTYIIEELLGSSDLGEVYRAKHVELGTAHTLKLIPPALAGDPRTVQLLVEEARKLARVRHDAVVSYEGLFRDEQGRRYLVTEYVDGPSLADVIAGRRLEPDEVLALRDRLADGLAAVHGRGIIHRDLSPENIVLPDGDIGRAKLTGFGFAKTAEAGDATLIGVNLWARHAYASPEQLGLFGGHIDSRSDLYSLGLVLASAAIGFGRTLDMGATPATAIAARQQAPDLSSVPAPLRPVIAPLLEPDPQNRPSSARALPEGGATAHAAGTPPPDGSGRSRSGRSVWLFATAGVVVVVLLAVAVAAAVALLRFAPAPAPSFDDIRNQLAAATASQGCGSLSYSLAPDRTVRLSGHLASADELARVRSQVTAIAGIGASSFDIELMPRPHCEMAALLGRLVDPAVRDGLSLAFTSGAGEVSIGAQPSFEIRAPGFDSYLYIDYFDSGGQVLHLFPNARDRFNLRPWRNRFVLFKSPLWTVCGNVGRQLVTIIATAKPLFPARRPDVEDAEDYIEVLAEALQRIPPAKTAASLLFFDLRDAPPWINRELACPSS
ncbi:MAG: protein kinase [Alphaproteobacteria bacterium]